MDHLKQKGISTGIHYPIPLHLQQAFSYLGHKEGDFPVSEKICFNEVSLPIYPYMNHEDVHYVCDVITNYFKKQPGVISVVPSGDVYAKWDLEIEYEKMKEVI